MRSAKPVVDEYWNYVSGRNANMNPHRMAFTPIVCVSETDAEAQRAAVGALSFGEYDEKGFIIAGSPATVRQRARELVTDWTPAVSQEGIAARAGSRTAPATA